MPPHLVLVASETSAIECNFLSDSFFPTLFMNRLQFWILIAGSSLVVIFLGLQALFVHQAQHVQGQVVAAQQEVAKGRSSENVLRQLIGRIYQVSQQTQDQGLKDLLTRQQISISPGPAAASSSAPAETPASTSLTH
jgi:hypothetical protein